MTEMLSVPSIHPHAILDLTISLFCPGIEFSTSFRDCLLRLVSLLTPDPVRGLS